MKTNMDTNNMNLTINTREKKIVLQNGTTSQALDLYSPEGFQILSRYWLEVGWTQKYSYSFTWMGRPVIQLPEDMIRIQETIFQLRPDVIVETGVAHGGSLIYYASLCKILDHGRVIGIDVEIRPPNRKALEAHFLAPYITLVEGSSVDPVVVRHLHSMIHPGEKVLVLLDSCHTKAHVLAELESYSPLVTVDSYLVVADGIMENLVGAPGTQPDWSWNNPRQAALEFLEKNSRFVLEEPVFPFNESAVEQRITYWPSAFLRRVA